jgi:DHA1 family inner membrane transport protein
MTLFTNRDLNRLAVHSTMHQLAWAISSAFSAVFLLRQGLSPAAIFLCLAAIIALRFISRPAVLFSARTIGLRATLIVGTFLYGVQSPLLALVHGLGTALMVYCVMAALAQAFYWTCYHAMFAAIGETSSRGSQVGWRELLIGIAGIVGPAMGGVMLTVAGPWAAFGVAGVIEFAAVVPLLDVVDPPIARTAPSGAFAFYKRGILLLGSDGWIYNSSAFAWSLFMFQGLGARYDAFGGTLAAAALAGALGGLALGHFIDRGHARRATWVNAATLGGTLIAKAVCGSDPIAIVAVAVGTTALAGLYVPSLMTAIYNEAKASPCPLRFHYAAEIGWDVGGSLACLAASALCAHGVSLQAVVALALPIVAVQAFLLDASYAERNSAIALVNAELPGR